MSNGEVTAPSKPSHQNLGPYRFRLLKVDPKTDTKMFVFLNQRVSFDGEWMSHSTPSNTLSFDILLFLVRYSAVQDTLAIYWHALIP